MALVVDFSAMHVAVIFHSECQIGYLRQQMFGDWDKVNYYDKVQ